MSDECDKCGNQVVECKCIAEFEQKATTYHYLGKKDKHIVDMFHWIEILEDLAYKVRCSEGNFELENEINNIVKRLTNEVGVRVVGLFK